LLFGLFLGSLSQDGLGDLYAMPRMIILIVLFIFMELTSLKIRLERRKWQNNPQDFTLDSTREEGLLPDKTTTRNPSRNGS
jgi:hypothetical protein